MFSGPVIKVLQTTSDPSAPASTAGLPTAKAPCGHIELFQIVEVTQTGEVVLRGGLDGPTFDQYINLDDQVDPGIVHPEYGRILRFRVLVRWVGQPPPSPLVGFPINVWCMDPTGQNRQELTAEESARVLPEGGPEGTVAAPAVVTVESEMDGIGQTGIIQVRLSVYGGDQLRIHAQAATESTVVTSQVYTVWRKLWYQVTTMQDRLGGDTLVLDPSIFESFQGSYRNVFIQFEEDAQNATRLPNRHVLLDPADEAGSMDYVNGALKHALVVDHLSPFKCHIISIDHCYSWEETAQRACLAQSMLCTQEHTFGPSRPFPINAVPAPERVLEPEGDETGAFDDVGYPADPAKPWLRSAFYRKDSEGTFALMPSAYIDLVPDPEMGLGYHFIRAKFPDDQEGGFYIGPQEQVEVMIYAYTVRDSFVLGLDSSDQHAILGTGVIGFKHANETKAAVLTGTLIHEIGHAVGLVNTNPPPGCHEHDWLWEDRYNSDAGKAHCEFNTCVMYFNTTSEQTMEFHTDAGRGCCHDYLRRLDLSRPVLSAHWR